MYRFCSIRTCGLAEFSDRLLAPYSLSWIVNPPAMIWLGLVGEATPWTAVAMVWAVTFLALKIGERIGEGSPELVTLASK